MKCLILLIVVFTVGCLPLEERLAKEQKEEVGELYNCPNDAAAFHKYFTECSNDWGNGLTAYGCLKYAHGLAKCGIKQSETEVDGGQNGNR
jgi:hypothetical protein